MTLSFSALVLAPGGCRRGALFSEGILSGGAWGQGVSLAMLIPPAERLPQRRAPRVAPLGSPAPPARPAQPPRLPRPGATSRSPLAKALLQTDGAPAPRASSAARSPTSSPPHPPRHGPD